MAAKPLAAAAIAQLEADGVATLIGTVVNPAGLTHAKTVPLRRMGAFADPGLGASPVWHVFAIDQAGIVFGDATGVVGDQRIRIDLSALRILGDGLAWAPGAFFNQDGSPDPYCSRGVLQPGRGAGCTDAGIDAVVGHEMEFLLVGPDGSRLPSHLWAQYGLAGVLEFEGFVRDVMNAATGSGVTIEQFHPEYGVNQFEISLSPQPPVAAADQLVLMRIIIGRVARQYGLRVSLSPVPFAGSVGSGAHQHFSMKRGETPLFSDGAGAGGMTPEGESAIAGLLAGLPEAQGVLCGSDPVGPADAAGSLVGCIRLLGDRKPGSRGAIPDRRAEQSARRERRGEGHRPVGQSVLRDRDDTRTRPRRHRTQAAAATRDDRRPRHTHRRPTQAGGHQAAGVEPGATPSMHSTNPPWCAAFSATSPSTRWSRCAATSRRTSAI